VRKWRKKTLSIRRGSRGDKREVRDDVRPDLGKRVESTESDLLPEIDHGVRIFDLVPVMEEEGDLDLYQRIGLSATMLGCISATSGSPS
jgi:hypothetical protein